MTSRSRSRPAGAPALSEPRRRTRRVDGFTLYEVIVVLVILAVVAGIVAPSFGRVLPSVKVSKSADEFLATAEKARTDAALTGRRHRLRIEQEPVPPEERPGYWFEYEPDPLGNPSVFRRPQGPWGDRVDLPDGVGFSGLEGIATDPETGAVCLEWNPDGTATGVSVSFVHEQGDQVTVEIDPDSGRVRIPPEEESK